jgi:hypothetical protein
MRRMIASPRPSLPFATISAGCLLVFSGADFSPDPPIFKPAGE